MFHTFIARPRSTLNLINGEMSVYNLSLVCHPASFKSLQQICLKSLSGNVLQQELHSLNRTSRNNFLSVLILEFSGI